MSLSIYTINSYWDDAREGKSPAFDIALYLTKTLSKHKKDRVFITTGDIDKGLRKKGINKPISSTAIDAVAQGMLEKNGIRAQYFKSPDGIGYYFTLNEPLKEAFNSLYLELIRRML